MLSFALIIIIVSLPGNTNLPADVCHRNGLPGIVQKIFVEAVFNLLLPPLGSGGVAGAVCRHVHHP